MSTADTATTVEPLDERGSAVRFESQCIVIPDPAHRSRRPRVVTKSYALPLWKRRTPSGSSISTAPPEEATCEENPSHLVLRVPLPTFSLRSHLTTRPADHTPLPPCLVHRPQPSSPSSPSLTRHARTPRKTSPSPSRSDIVTVPLRPCCAACQSVTDAALVDGDGLPERFSRAASRRRSLSADGSPRTLTVAGSAASASYGALGIAISVDEIDKRRRASDSGPSTTSRDLWPDISTDEHRPSLALPRTVLSNATAYAADTRPPPSPSSRMAATPATPRIPEEEDDEDESELFPLPSPKRTPTASPAPSLTGSLSSLVVPPNQHQHQHQNSGTSPTPSTCSGESAGSHPHAHSHRRLLAPPPCASSSSSLSLPRLSGSMADLGAEDPPRVPSPSLLSTLPSISGRYRSPSPLPTDGSDPNPSVVTPTPVVAVSAQQPSVSSPCASPAQTRLSWRGKRAGASPDVQAPAPEAPPSSTALNGKKSFSMSSPLQLFADVFRGVSAIGSGGGVTGV